MLLMCRCCTSPEAFGSLRLRSGLPSASKQAKMLPLIWRARRQCCRDGLQQRGCLTPTDAIALSPLLEISTDTPEGLRCLTDARIAPEPPPVVLCF